MYKNHINKKLRVKRIRSKRIKLTKINKDKLIGYDKIISDFIKFAKTFTDKDIYLNDNNIDFIIHTVELFSHRIDGLINYINILNKKKVL
jgi:hypothetical protein